MPTNVLAKTLPPPDCSTEQLAREWAVTFAELFRVSLKERGPCFVDLWVSALHDLAPEILDAACQRAMKVCKFFPTPAEIREPIDNADSAGLELEAAAAWDMWFKHVMKFYRGDLGWIRGTPSLSPIVEHAASGVAGGPSWVSSCPESKLEWCRKDFIKAFVQASECSEGEHLLTRLGAKKLVAELSAIAPEGTKGLPASAKPQPAPICESEQKALDEAAVREREKFETEIRAPWQAPAPIGEEELSRRRDEQLARFRAYLAAHPELYTTAPKHEDQPAASVTESVCG